MRSKTLLGGTCTAALLLAGVAALAEVTPERLANAGTEAEAGNWLMVHKTYDSNRYSSLSEINASNVANLKLAFAAPFGGTEPTGFGVGGVETTPLADNGFLYLSDPWGTPYKYDLSDGKQAKLAWICDTGVDKDPSRGVLLASRGLALAGNEVITALNDGRVVACDSGRATSSGSSKSAKSRAKALPVRPWSSGTRFWSGSLMATGPRAAGLQHSRSIRAKRSGALTSCQSPAIRDRKLGNVTRRAIRTAGKQAAVLLG